MRSIALLLLLAGPAFAQPLVAPTDAKTPEDERKSFKLPPGFTAQLVASEPDIQKPMQLAFDAKGRIWVTTSYHYPFAAEKGKASDKLFILSEFDANGKAQKVETFDDKLNIPIGILPLPDCKSCIVSSVGEILKLTDTDGDGKADRREVLFTGFGSRDTHGMYNSYTYMPDGWVYACHGFANDSHVKGKDGHEVHLNSGNTFRFRPDGSRIEVFTRGQVNPFGMTVDPWFNLYTADCHSKPITQLIKGAYYDSFGKPHDGLGYAPHVTQHQHGSTGLCGLAWYDADHFPKEWNGVMFLGNVVTSRINIDRIEWKGSTPVAKELPDFLVSSDPWFRPVDIKLGPDGALYVNDFYNKIIGHYEVDLKHPGRDKGRGRMWRIVWTGQSEPGASATGGSPKMPFTDLTKESPKRLAELTVSKNITTRLMATRELLSRGKSILPIAKEMYGKYRSEAGKVWPELANYHYLAWVISRFEYDRIALLGLDGGPVAAPVDELLVAKALECRPIDPAAAKLFDESQAFLRVENQKSNRIDFRAGQLFESIYKNGLRTVIDYMILDQSVLNVDQLGFLSHIVVTAKPDDITLKHAARIAMRNVLADPELQEQLVWALKSHIQDEGKQVAVLDDVFLGVPTAYAGWWLSERLKSGRIAPALEERAIQQVGRYGCDCHRGIVEQASMNPNDKLKSVNRLVALQRGARAGGANYRVTNRTVLENWLERENDAVGIGCIEILDYQFNKSWPENWHIVQTILLDPKRGEQLRIASLTALERAAPTQVLPAARTIILDERTPPGLRELCLAPFSASTKLLDQIALKDLLKTSPYRQCVTIANGLASNKTGTDQLFAAVKAGNASARLLQEKSVLERLKATNAPKWEATVKELTAGIPSADARLAALIKERGDGYKKARPDREAGKRIFTTTCANCHQVGGQGAKVGPQLDGIGNRGVERLMEDTLDPNRNVDHAFHTTILDLKDGGQLTGLLRVEGKVFIMVDAQAKETRVNEADVEKKRTTPISPMPSDIAEKLKPDDFFNLIAYLADLRAK